MLIYRLLTYINIFLFKLINLPSFFEINWGLGIGDWGLGIGPNPQTPIPQPQTPNPISTQYKKLNLLKII